MDTSSAFRRNSFGSHQNHSSIYSIFYGTDAYLLEDELNETQWNRIEHIASLLRYQYIGGFSDPFHYGTTGYKNLFYVQADDANPIALLVDGYNIMVGYNTYPNLPVDIPVTDNTVVVQLNDANPFTDRMDLVMLELWFEVIDFEEDLHKYGGDTTPLLPNNMMDTRMNQETSRRVQFRWRVRVCDNTDTPDGLTALLYDGSDSSVPYKMLENGIYSAVTGVMHNAEGNVKSGDTVYAVPLCRVFRPAGNSIITLENIVDMSPISNFRVMDITVKKNLTVDGDLRVTGNFTNIVVSTYEYNQSTTPTIMWTIQHNLNKYPSVVIVDNYGNQIIGDVKYESRDRVTISFSSPVAGFAYLN